MHQVPPPLRAAGHAPFLRFPHELLVSRSRSPVPAFGTGPVLPLVSSQPRRRARGGDGPRRKDEVRGGAAVGADGRIYFVVEKGRVAGERMPVTAAKSPNRVLSPIVA